MEKIIPINQSTELKQPKIYRPDLTESKLATYVLLQMHISSNLLGYKYLHTAIALNLKHPYMNEKICKELYPEICRVFRKVRPNINSAQVERSIRHTFDSIWVERSNLSIITDIFGEGVLNKRPPSNSKGIAMICDYIRFMYYDE